MGNSTKGALLAGAFVLALGGGSVLAQNQAGSDDAPAYTPGAPHFIELGDDHTVLSDGEQIFQYWCWDCHGEPEVGGRKPGTNALAALYQGDVPAVLSERTDLAPETIEFFVRNGTSVMPFFRATQISDEQLAAMIDYLTRNNP